MGAVLGRWRLLGAVAVIVVAAAGCWPTPTPPGTWAPPSGLPSRNHIYLEEVGPAGTRTKLMTSADARISVGEDRYHQIHLEAVSTFGIVGSVKPPEALGGPLQPGYYGNTSRFPAPQDGLLDWSTFRPWACNTVDGWFDVGHVARDANGLTELDLRVGFICDDDGQVVNASVHWRKSDPTVPPGPTAPPAGLWTPPAAALPEAGNFLYVESDSNAYGGLRGRNEVFTALETTFVRPNWFNGAKIELTSPFDNGYLQLDRIHGQDRLTPGYYAQPPGHLGDPTVGHSEINLENLVCTTLDGWFVIDEISYRPVGWVGYELASIDVRFENHCAGNVGKTRGRLRWSATDLALPTQPVVPISYRAWEPWAGDVPAPGNVVILEHEPGYPSGADNTILSAATHTVHVVPNGGGVDITVDGPEVWFGQIRPMAPNQSLRHGLYPAGPFSRQTARATVSWSNLTTGEHCAVGGGWFAVDSIGYGSDGSVSSLALRFEQDCDPGRYGPMRGAVRFSAGDTAKPNGIAPEPAGLWRPPAGSTPAIGNYVYVESEAGDVIGQGRTTLLTAPPAELHVWPEGPHVRMMVRQGDQDQRFGDLTMPNWLDHVRPGFYGGLTRDPVHDRAVGGLDWSENGFGCNALTGWLAVDVAEHDSSGALIALEIRFEQHCEGAAPALHGAVRWHA